ncbi:RING finger protein 225 [Collichthys lucidus]|uniref:RING finger protein 225 n=1 Tax=Collichthys lucidus TaxID=240159 RepID=A0A4U5UT97_COLLU|nr:RING finger protein 225 [Collichthys lucidus]TKS77938.1 RING finger protein 225 [Collichthys lucidus]
MNPYEDTHVNSDPCNDVNAPGSPESPHPYSTPDPQDNSHNPYPSTTVSSAPVIQTGHSFPSPDLPLPASDPTLTLNPYSTPITLLTSQVSVTIPSPDLQPSPLQSRCLEETCPDLECAICFSQFNNVFRCPKMLQCKHTFCLECLARMNVKSAQPNAIQCPLCRGFTPLPTLGLPRLATDSDVLSYLPAAMQRVYSIRFLRDKGKLQVKRSSEGRHRWGERSLTSMNRSLDVGLPNPPVTGHNMGGALFQLTGRPACRAFLLTSVVMMMVLLTGIIIFLLTFNKQQQ